MTVLEQEIIERVRGLDESRKRQVLDYIDQLEETPKPKFDFADWLSRVEAVQAEMRAEYGDDYRIDVVGMLREIRNEED